MRELFYVVLCLGALGLMPGRAFSQGGPQDLCSRCLNPAGDNNFFCFDNQFPSGISVCYTQWEIDELGETHFSCTMEGAHICPVHWASGDALSPSGIPVLTSPFLSNVIDGEIKDPCSGVFLGYSVSSGKEIWKEKKIVI